MPRQLEGAEGPASNSPRARHTRQEPYSTTRRATKKADENTLSLTTKLDRGRSLGSNKIRRSSGHASSKPVNIVTRKTKVATNDAPRTPLADIGTLTEPKPTILPQFAAPSTSKTSLVIHRGCSTTASTSDTECSDTSPVDAIKTRASGIERSIQELESLAQGFKLKVDRVALHLEALKEELDEYARGYSGLQTDYSMALAALDEEKHTAETYHGALRNAEVEIKILKSLVPDEKLDYQHGFSQARPW